jgi:hypothetical protein
VAASWQEADVSFDSFPACLSPRQRPLRRSTLSRQIPPRSLSAIAKKRDVLWRRRFAGGFRNTLRVDRSDATIRPFDDEADDDYVEGPRADRVAMVRELTVEAWSLSTPGAVDAESRFQRDGVSPKPTPR